MSCEYCKENTHLMSWSDYSEDYSLDLELDGKNGLIISVSNEDDGESLFDVNYSINFCPMCGEPLTEPKPLTLEELFQMAGKPVWIEECESWGIVKIDKAGAYENQVFVRGSSYKCNGEKMDYGFDFEYDVEKRNLSCYTRPPRGEINGKIYNEVSNYQG